MITIDKRKKAKGFKIVLDGRSASLYTGQLYNASFSFDINSIMTREEYLGKSYNMNVSFQSTPYSLLTRSNIYTVGIDINNGLTVGRVFQNKPNNNLTTAILNIAQDNNTYSATLNASATTITTNAITVGNTANLRVGMTVQLSGAVFGGLMQGYYTIATIIDTFNFTISGLTLSTASGSCQVLYYTSNPTYLTCNYNDNPPSYIKSVDGLTSINLKAYSGVATDAYNTVLTSYICILNFEEIE